MTLFLVSLALTYIITVYFLTNPLRHDRKFMWRRFTNWFPLGMTYSFLYMGRYNLTVAAVALGGLFTKAEFGWVASVGATTYALALTFVGPVVDRIGGKRGMIVGALGSALMNAAMAGVLFLVLNGRKELTFGPVSLPLSLPVWFAVLYGLNMLCQSFGAISTIKVKSYWFHVRERGTFGAIFGTLISLGVYFAFDWGRAIAGAVQLEQPKEPTVARQILNQLFLLDGRTVPALWLIFVIPAILMVIWAFIDAAMLKDTPDQAGFPPLDTHDASHDEAPDQRQSYLGLIWKIVSNPIILMIGVVELTSGVLRDGILNWYLLFAKETPLGVKTVTENWGMWGAVTGIMGGFAAGWVSDRFFQSRRAPAAGLMQVVMFATTGIMVLSLWWLPSGATMESTGAAEGSFTAWFIGARPWIMGICAVGTMMAVIGVHSIMSGTATADFGGKKAAATATGIADAASKLGSALQAAVIGQLVTRDWIWWPAFLFPFTVIGLIFAIRMWTLLPAATKRYLAEVEGRSLPAGRNEEHFPKGSKRGANLPRSMSAVEGSSPISRHLPSFLASAGMCAAFFMPWISILGIGLSGSTLGQIGSDGQMNWLILAMAGITAITHFTGPKRVLNVITGVLPFAMLSYFASKIGLDLFRGLAIGAWLTLGCGLVLIVAPVKSLRGS